MRTEAWNRRSFLSAAGALGLSGAPPSSAATEPRPETARIRLAQGSAICFAPIYVAGEGLLQAEGFSDVGLAPPRTTMQAAIIEGIADIGATDVSSLLALLDQGRPLVALAGLHSGCYELFATQSVRTMRDLKGASVAVPGLHLGRHLTMSAMLAHVGLDPRKDVNWVTHPAAEAMQLLAQGKIDAFLGFPPEPQELRANKTGRLILSMTTDRPWAEYYCCMVIARPEFVRANPVATKRALRAILKAAAVCTNEPERATRILVERKLTTKVDYALQMMKELPYARWREYDPTSTLRFYALRLREAGLIHASPQTLIAQGTDFRNLDALKRELKS